jgi:glycosyltransferase involved in cell wall biosynthesis
MAMPTSPPTDPDIRATVIIRALNEVRDIGAVLDAVLAQDEPCRVIVIDSGSTDGTVEEVMRRPAVQLHRIDRASFSYGRACNLGAALAGTPFVCYLSAHALPAHRGWLAALLTPFDDPRVAGVWGRQLPRPEQDPLRSYHQLEGNTASADTVLTTFSNANSAIRRSDWERVPFDELLSGTEDYDWMRTMVASGREVRYAPDAEAYHSHREGLRQVYRRYRNEAEGLLRWRGPRGRRATLRLWREISLRDARRLLRGGHVRWAAWAPFYYAAMFAGDFAGARRARRSPGQALTGEG